MIIPVIGVLLVVCVVVGIYVSRGLQPHLPELLEQEEGQQHLLQSCAVCGDKNCTRQKANGDHQPWTGLDIPREIDQALQDLFNKLLNEYISEWYEKVSSDNAFLWELRERLRFACAVLLRRFLRINLGEVICEKLVPLLLRHVDDFAIASDGCSSEEEKVATVVAHLGDRVHPAARSRQAELEYLRSISRLLVTLGVPSQDLQCRPFEILLVELLSGWVLLTLSDVLCSPVILNHLVVLAISPDKLAVPVSSNAKVQFLQAFATRPCVSSPSPIRPGLRTLLNEQKYLYPLIQYMKRIGRVNLLQFCLDVEDFNMRMLVPERLPANVQKSLFKEAWQLYYRYLVSGAVDAIRVSPGVPEQFYQVLTKGGEDITRLQTSTPLFQAYEETFCIIEQTHLPGFYLSDFYFELLCARRQPLTYKRAAQVKPKEPIVSKLSHKLQKLVTGSNPDFGLSVETASDASELEDDLDLVMASDFEFQNMSDWDVQITGADTEQVANSRPYPVFFIRVIADFGDDVWEVKRKLSDFYTLESKLLEYHQKLPEELPVKKGLFSPRGEEYLEGRRKLFEAYLQNMIRHPELCCSDIVHCFLRSPNEFHMALREPISLYAMLRRSIAPMQLRKERGRYLDHFITSLLASIENQNEPEIIYEEHTASAKRDIRRTCFKDNLAPVLKQVASWPTTTVRPVLRLTSAWDCLLFTMGRLLGCGAWIQRLVLTVKVAMGNAASPFIHRHINSAIGAALIPRLPYLIRLLQGAILSPNPSKIHSMDEAKRLYNELCETIRNPSSMIAMKTLRVTAPRWQEGAISVLETLQHPTLNKHLYYCLLDEALRALFSEFSTLTAVKS